MERTWWSGGPQVPLFEGLRPEALQVIRERGVVRRLPAGSVLWTAGGEPRGLFVVLEGAVKVVRAPAGRQYVVHTEGPGGTLGEVPLFSGGRYPATAMAVVRTTCVVLDRATLSAAMALDPELAFRLLGRLSERVRTVVARLDGISGDPVRVRLARLLLARAPAHGAAFTLGATHVEVAEELGTAREVVVKELRRLRAAGVLASAGRGRYRVADGGALRRCAAGDDAAFSVTRGPAA